MADRVTAEYTFNDMSDKKSTKNLPYLSTSATDNQIKALVEGLNGLTTNTLLEINRVETTDITNGGLEDVGYSFCPDDENTADWNSTPADFAPKQCNGKDNPMFSVQLMSKTGNGYFSGAREVTFSGYKPKGSTLEFAAEKGIVRIKMPDKPAYSMDNGQEYQLRVQIAPTEQNAAGVIYLYFYAMPEDMEAINNG